MKFFVLPVGKCDDDKGLVFTPGQDDGKRMIAPNWAGLIQVDGMNILIDTGMHPVHITTPLTTFQGTRYEKLICPMMDEEDFILHRLAAIGVRPEQIDYVINTHLHFDHAGCNEFFPGAAFIVQKEHYLYARSMPGEFPTRYYHLPELRYDLIDGEMTLIPGVDLIRCPGHVPGMMAVILRFSKSPPIIIASDAISIKECLTTNNWKASWNPLLAGKSAKRLASIAGIESGHLFYGHDPEWWKTIKVSPQYYE